MDVARKNDDGNNKCKAMRFKGADFVSFTSIFTFQEINDFMKFVSGGRKVEARNSQNERKKLGEEKSREKTFPR